jgi:lysophospholipase L1-like esterase
LPALDAVRRIQFDQAARHQAAFWNGAATQSRSGGINGWAAANPPLARADHIHFTPAGYALLAADLYRWLIDGFAAYQRAPHASRAPL